MSVSRSPPNKSEQTTTPSSSAKPRNLRQQTIDKSLYEAKQNEKIGNTEQNASTPFKRRREEDLLADFSTFKEEIKTMIESFMTSQQNEIEIITTNLKEIQQSSQNIDSSVALLTSQNEEYRKKIDRLERQSKKDNERITFLEDQIEDMKRESRKTNIEIKNVPKKQNENKEDLVEMVLSLSKNISCKVEKSNIKDIYRVNGKKYTEKNTPIIVEMDSTIIKTDMIKMSKSYNIRNSKNKLQAKHLGFTTNEHVPIYVSEQLTAKAARYYFLARDLTKTKQYKFCWTSFGRVYVRLNETSPIVQIKSEAQVHQLLQSTKDT